MLIYLLYGLFLAACAVLVTAVLLQPGKTDAGALFTSNISSTAFGPRGTQSVLAKITIGAAVTFMVAAFLLSQPAITGTRSVLDTVAAPAESPAPAASPAAADQANNANVATVENTANTNSAANANTADAPANK